MAAAGLFLVLAFGVGVPLVLYLLIRAETSDPEIVDRTTAERLARRRGGRRDAGETDDAHGDWSPRVRKRDDGDGGGWGDTER